MKKRKANIIVEVYADCLRQLYDEAELEFPEEFYADEEASKLASALISKGLGIKL